MKQQSQPEKLNCSSYEKHVSVSKYPKLYHNPYPFSKCHRQSQNLRLLMDRALGFHLVCRMQCCSVLCAVPTQLCSFAEMGIGSHVRPARQSRDCLRGRPLRAPPLFAAVRLALGIGTAHRCTRRVGGTSAHPHSASDSSFGVVLRIHAHMRPHGLGRNTSHKPCASPLHPSAQSRLSPESPAPWLMHLVRPRYMSGIPFYRLWRKP